MSTSCYYSLCTVGMSMLYMLFGVGFGFLYKLLGSAPLSISHQNRFLSIQNIIHIFQKSFKRLYITKIHFWWNTFFLNTGAYSGVTALHPPQDVCRQMPLLHQNFVDKCPPFIQQTAWTGKRYKEGKRVEISKIVTYFTIFWSKMGNG